MVKKIVVPICGIDDSMEGYSLNGWEIKKLLPTSEGHTIFNDIADSSLYQQIRNLLNTMEDVLSVVSFTNDDLNPYYMVFVKEADDAAEMQSIVDVLRVFKTSKFGCWHPIIFKHNRATIGYSRSYSTSALQIRPTLCLSTEEQKQIALLLQKRYSERDSQSLQMVNMMLQFFHESCRLDNLYLSFITRVTILEMLLGENAELSYRLRRYVAVLLGRDKKESIEIADNLKKIYTKRSKFLHEGNAEDISDELMQLAYEYSRRVVANLLCISEDIKSIRTTLDQAGYGDNPYNVAI